MRLKKLMTLLVIITMLSVNTIAKTKTLEQCESTLKKCDLAVEGLEAALNLQGDLLDLKNDEIAARGKEIDRLRAKDDSLLSNPYFMFGIGVVAGGLAYSLIKK